MEYIQYLGDLRVKDLTPTTESMILSIQKLNGTDFTNGTPKVSKLRYRACLDTRGFFRSVKRGSCWRFLGYWG